MKSFRRSRLESHRGIRGVEEDGSRTADVAVIKLNVETNLCWSDDKSIRDNSREREPRFPGTYTSVPRHCVRQNENCIAGDARAIANIVLRYLFSPLSAPLR